MALRSVTAIASVLLILLSAPAVENTVAEKPEEQVVNTIREISSLESVAVEVPADASIAFNFIDLPPSVQKPEPVVATPIPKENPEKANPSVVSTETKVANNEIVEQPPVAPTTRYIDVALAGGQNVVDMGAGPVLYPLGGSFPPYVAEHDYAGGWDRIGTLTPGMSVTMTGLVTGTYTVGQIINVAKGANTDSFAAFGAMPTVLLQTCVPGTDRMIVVGLY